MSDGIQLTVLTPTRNYGRFLAGCLQSVADQGRSDVEHIVVDGASTDETLDVLEAWDGPRMRWMSEPDRNQSDALNKGAALAQGQWLCWLNADEFYLPGTLDAVIAAIRSEPPVDVIHGDFVEVDERGRLRRFLPQHRFAQPVLDWFGPYMPSCATFFRRSRLQEPVWDVELRYVMDWDLWLRLTHDGARVRHLQRPLAAFTVHDESLTGTGLPLDHPELQALRQRHRLPHGRMTRPAWWSARAMRVAMKTVNGSYRRRKAVAALQGRDIRWYTDEDARTAAQRLVELGSG